MFKQKTKHFEDKILYRKRKLLNFCWVNYFWFVVYTSKIRDWNFDIEMENQKKCIIVNDE